MGASWASQPVHISIKWNKITGQQENWSTNAHIKKGDEEKRYFYAMKEV